MFHKYLVTLMLSAGIIALFNVVALAQLGQLRGHVLFNSADGATVSADKAVVDVYRTDQPGTYNTTTNKEGKFLLVLPNEGIYIITASMQGAEPALLVDVRVGRNTDYELTLAPCNGRRLSLADIEKMMNANEAREVEPQKQQSVGTRKQEQKELGDKQSLDIPSLTESERASAMAAIKALRKLQSVVSVGVTYREYGTRVADAQIAVDEALPNIPESRSGLKDNIKSAMKEYGKALTEWSQNLQFDIKYGSKTTDKTGAAVVRSMWNVAKLDIEAAENSLNCRRSPC